MKLTITQVARFSAAIAALVYAGTYLFAQTGGGTETGSAGGCTAPGLGSTPGSPQGPAVQPGASPGISPGAGTSPGTASNPGANQWQGANQGQGAMPGTSPSQGERSGCGGNRRGWLFAERRGVFSTGNPLIDQKRSAARPGERFPQRGVLPSPAARSSK